MPWNCSLQKWLILCYMNFTWNCVWDLNQWIIRQTKNKSKRCHQGLSLKVYRTSIQALVGWGVSVDKLDVILMGLYKRVGPFPLKCLIYFVFIYLVFLLLGISFLVLSTWCSVCFLYHDRHLFLFKLGNLFSIILFKIFSMLLGLCFFFLLRGLWRGRF